MFEDIYEFLRDAFLALLEFIVDLIFMVFDAVVLLLFGFFDEMFADAGLLDISSITSQLPDEVTHVWSVLHLNECMSVLVAALAIRFLIQMIPFVRHGS